MLRNILQFWGGVAYLLNKVFLSCAERNTAEIKRKWLIWSWIVYLFGLAPWVIILVKEHNWIVAAVEAGGAPAMMLGLITAIHGKQQQRYNWLDHLAQIFATLGIAYSLYYYGGITTMSQVYELGTSAGFLIGTYMLAKQRPSGYLWFMLMNASNGALMGLEHYPWLMWQQIISLGFIIDAWIMQKRQAQTILSVA